MVSPLDSFSQSSFLPSSFFFSLHRQGTSFYRDTTPHDHGWKSTKAHSSGVLPTRITRYPSITMSFPFADRMPRDLPFSFSRSASSPTVISPLVFSGRSSSQILEILAIFIGGSSLSRREISRAHIILNRSTTRPSTRVDCDLYAWQGLYFTSFDPLNPVD